MWECRKCHEKQDDAVVICWSCGTAKDGREDPHFRREGEEPRGDAGGRRSRSVDQLVFVGLRGYAVALDRDTGEIVWSNNEMHSGYVSLLLDGDRLIVSTNGYTYCLDPLTGRILWHNPLSGYGVGPTSICSVRGQSSQALIQQAAASEAAQRRSSQGT
jgi:outer membrane protein assembly factor BamB